jgi:hypothetical protein
MNKHTPAPWHVVDYSVRTVKGDGATADCYDGERGLHNMTPAHDARTIANARLIAAAPELLGALIDAELHLRNPNRDKSSHAIVCAAARAAINKATGMSPMTSKPTDGGEWVSVPREPTEAMIRAGCDEKLYLDPEITRLAGYAKQKRKMVARYKAMVAAASASPAPASADGVVVPRTVLEHYAAFEEAFDDAECLSHREKCKGHTECLCGYTRLSDAYDELSGEARAILNNDPPPLLAALSTPAAAALKEKAE